MPDLHLHFSLGERFGFRVSSLGFRVEGFGFRVLGFGFQVSGFGFGVSGFSLWVSGFGFERQSEITGSASTGLTLYLNHLAQYLKL